MLPGNTYVRECPLCFGKYTHSSMLSGNTFGAKFWPDGKMDAPMMPEYPAYVGCPHCKGNFWVEDTKIVKSFGYNEEREIPDLTLDSNQNPVPYTLPTKKIYLQGLDDLEDNLSLDETRTEDNWQLTPDDNDSNKLQLLRRELFEIRDLLN